MSDTEQSPEAAAATLTPQLVSDAIKGAFGSFKAYCDFSILKIKEDSKKKLSEDSSELQHLKRTQEFLFCFKGNKTQFDLILGYVALSCHQSSVFPHNTVCAFINVSLSGGANIVGRQD